MDIQRELVFSIKSQDYTIKFPNVGQYLMIETKKIQLSSDTYSQMALSRMVSAGKALNLIDMIATLSVLCPELMKDSKVTLLDLDIIDMKDLISVWDGSIKAWVEVWMKLFMDSPAEEINSKA